MPVKYGYLNSISQRCAEQNPVLMLHSEMPKYGLYCSLIINRVLSKGVSAKCSTGQGELQRNQPPTSSNIICVYETTYLIILK